MLQFFRFVRLRCGCRSVTAGNSREKSECSSGRSSTAAPPPGDGVRRVNLPSFIVRARNEADVLDVRNQTS